MGLIDRLEDAFSKLKAKGMADGDILSVLKRLIHSPAVAIIVALTPTKADDVVLETLKALFPAS